MKKKISLSAIISFVLFLTWFCITFDAYFSTNGRIEDAALILMMVIWGNAFGIINLVLLVRIRNKPIRTENGLVIFLCIHTLIWSSAYFLICALSTSIEDKVPLFFLFPLVMSTLTSRKIILRLNPNRSVSNM